MPLNAKQQLFIAEYLVDKNATEAAKRAGYSEKTAQEQGSRLLSNAIVKHELELALAKQLSDIADRGKVKRMTKEMWLEELEIIASANIDDFITIDVTEVQHGELGEVRDIIQANPIPTNARSKFLGRAIKKISETKNGIGIELHSKQAALETLGKHYGWVTNDTNINLPSNVRVNVNLPANGTEIQVQEPQPKQLESKEPNDGTSD